MLFRVCRPFVFCLIVYTYFPLLAQHVSKPFSSDVTYTVNGETLSGKIYSDGRSARIDSQGLSPGQENITFVRLDSGLTQVMIPQLNAFAEYPYGSSRDAQFVSYLQDAEVKGQPLGAEPLDSETCDKVLVTSSYHGRMYTSIEWRSRKLHGFALRSQDAQGQWSTEHRNVRIGEQNPSLFEIPAGYTRIAYSQDWSAVLKQIQFAEEMSDRIAIAKKAGLKVVGDRGNQVAEDSPPVFAVLFKDPVTGSSVMDLTTNEDSLLPSLPAPILRSPENGTVFRQFSRKMELQWNPLPNAGSYVVQIVVFPIERKETPYWQLDRDLTYIQQVTKSARFSFELGGAQSARWRVWAQDAHGTQGLKSSWSTFELTR